MSNSLESYQNTSADIRVFREKDAPCGAISTAFNRCGNALFWQGRSRSEISLLCKEIDAASVIVTVHHECDTSDIAFSLKPFTFKRQITTFTGIPVGSCAMRSTFTRDRNEQFLMRERAITVPGQL